MEKETKELLYYYMYYIPLLLYEKWSYIAD